MLVEVERLALGFDVVNLLPSYPGRASGKGDRFPLAEARAAAAKLEEHAPHDRVVLLGRAVCKAFGLRLAPLEDRVERGRRWLHVPHPSGVNLWWNEEANAEAAGRALRGIMTPARAA